MALTDQAFLDRISTPLRRPLFCLRFATPISDRMTLELPTASDQAFLNRTPAHNLRT